MSPEERRRIVKAFAESDAWKLYLLPMLSKQMEEIKVRLLNDEISEKETTRLRARHALLSELTHQIPCAPVAFPDTPRAESS